MSSITLFIAWHVSISYIFDGHGFSSEFYFAVPAHALTSSMCSLISSYCKIIRGGRIMVSHSRSVWRARAAPEAKMSRATVTPGGYGKLPHTHDIVAKAVVGDYDVSAAGGLLDRSRRL